jgi:hypothetical protein
MVFLYGNLFVYWFYLVSIVSLFWAGYAAIYFLWLLYEQSKPYFIKAWDYVSETSTSAYNSVTTWFTEKWTQLTAPSQEYQELVEAMSEFESFLNSHRVVQSS